MLRQLYRPRRTLAHFLIFHKLDAYNLAHFVHDDSESYYHDTNSLVTPTDPRTPQNSQRRTWRKIVGYGSYAMSAPLATTYSSTLFNFSHTRQMHSQSVRPRRSLFVIEIYPEYLLPARVRSQNVAATTTCSTFRLLTYVQF